MAFGRRRLVPLWTPLCAVVAALTGADGVQPPCPPICYTAAVYTYMDVGTTCACVLNMSTYERTPLDSACQCPQCLYQNGDGVYSIAGANCPSFATDCSTCDYVGDLDSPMNATSMSAPAATPSPAPTASPSTSASPTSTVAATAHASSSSGHGGWRNGLFIAIFACGCALAVGAVFLLAWDLYQRAKGVNAVESDETEDEHLSNGELRGAPMASSYAHLRDSDQVYEVLVYPLDPLAEDIDPQRHLRSNIQIH